WPVRQCRWLVLLLFLVPTPPQPQFHDLVWLAKSRLSPMANRAGGARLPDRSRRGARLLGPFIWARRQFLEKTIGQQPFVAEFVRIRPLNSFSYVITRESPASGRSVFSS